MQTTIHGDVIDEIKKLAEQGLVPEAEIDGVLDLLKLTRGG